jgi:hypothetical protein
LNVAGPISAEKDVKDAIYNNDDPLDISLTKRMKEGGSKISQVPDKSNTQGKFFFSLKFKGEPIPISDQAKINVAKLDNKQIEKVDGQLVLEPKAAKIIDPIGDSVAIRVKEGSLISVVKAGDKKQADTEPTKL